MTTPLRHDTHVRIRSFLLIFLFVLAALGLVANDGGVASIALLLALLTIVDISLDAFERQARRSGRVR
ncbi:hypothetical protein ACIBG8_01565 [Nonomuraea sp. NPDC050556]|uniref:hypothetical protein n=1 Tax=Nonomuraea sp. NPDC050556 TaxID=3364369 RepID=UPI003796021A